MRRIFGGVDGVGDGWYFLVIKFGGNSFLRVCSQQVLRNLVITCRWVEPGSLRVHRMSIQNRRVFIGKAMPVKYCMQFSWVMDGIAWWPPPFGHSKEHGVIDVFRISNQECLDFMICEGSCVQMRLNTCTHTDAPIYFAHVLLTHLSNVLTNFWFTHLES